jgi:hypothetical protein
MTIAQELDASSHMAFVDARRARHELITVELLVALFVSTLLATGCMSTKSAIDPAYNKTKYEDIAQPAEAYKWRVSVQFLVDGKPYQRGDSMLQDQVERVLQDSGLIVPTPDSTSGEIHVILNDSYNKAATVTKLFGYVLTFGLIGTTVTDYFEMEVTITTNGKTFHKRGIRHTLYTTVGNAKLPEGSQSVPQQTAVHRIVEEMLLNALKEFQQSGSLVSLHTSLRNGTLGFPGFAGACALGSAYGFLQGGWPFGISFTGQVPQRPAPYVRARARSTPPRAKIHKSRMHCAVSRLLCPASMRRV